ncbi:Aspartic proteinase CDR1 [Linum perenne]
MTRVPTTFALTVVVWMIINCCCSSVNAHSVGFSVDLIHREYSSNSPSYNPREVPSERVRNVINRSLGRMTRFASMLHVDFDYSFAPTSPVGDIVAPLVLAGDGEYLMNISLGSPPFSILAIADTVSDITWTQCLPCTNCYEQDALIFDPRFSSTYKLVSCSSTTCNSLAHEGSFWSPEGNDTCQYRLTYGDDTHA